MTMQMRFFKDISSSSEYHFTEIPDPRIWIDQFIHSSHLDRTGLIMKVAEKEDFNQLAKHVEKFRDSTRLADRTARGDVCIVTYRDEVLAHFRWAALSPIPLSELNGQILHLGDDEAYTYDSYTVPAFRRRGVASETRQFLITFLSQQGKNTIYSMTRTDNVRSSRSKRDRQGVQRTFGLIRVISRLGRTTYRFYVTTTRDRQRLAKLFQIPLQNVILSTTLSL
jgi:GNAT superfamily N-acetyltransferase